ncbi:MAG: helix-turn-helix domain-containing protein [Erysipelotrichales bacterium]|nr:helix-turn-helix domain-containing protein [Erysipelotrichales bacterium]
MSNKFGEFLYELRKERNMTQADLADKLDLTNKAVSKWETGETMPETQQLIPIAKIFNITVDELLSGRRINSQTIDGQNHINYEEDKIMSIKFILMIALGVGIILIGVVTMVIMDYLDIYHDRYVPIFLAFVAIGAPICTYAGMVKSIEDKEPSANILKQGKKLSLAISIGVMLCILSPISIVAVSERFDETNMAILGVSIFFTLIIIAVAIFIIYGSLWSNYDKRYLKESGASKVKSEKKKHREKIIGTLCAAIWMIAIAVYLTLGFTLDLWHINWVTFLVAALLSGVVVVIVEGFTKE